MFWCLKSAGEPTIYFLVQLQSIVITIVIFKRLKYIGICLHIVLYKLLHLEFSDFQGSLFSRKPDPLSFFDPLLKKKPLPPTIF